LITVDMGDFDDELLREVEEERAGLEERVVFPPLLLPCAAGALPEDDADFEP
jgi:hypothetical protein